MKIEILKPTVCGRARVAAGTVVDAPESDAQTLILMGKARKIVEVPAPALAAGSEGPAAGEENRAIGLNSESGGVLIKRGRRGK